MTWWSGPLAAFDLETTGPEPTTDRIVTAAVVARNPGGEIAGVDRHWLADPGVPISEGATKVHGITTAHAQANGWPIATVVDQVVAALAELVAQCPLVIYNAPFDLTMLDREARRHGIRPLDLTQAVIVDPLVLDKQLDRYRKGSRRLDACCAHYQVTLDEAHEATADALAAMRVAWRIGKAYPKVGSLPGRDLMAYQARARAAQANSLAAYFKCTGQPQPVSREWPVQALKGDVVL